MFSHAVLSHPFFTLPSVSKLLIHFAPVLPILVCSLIRRAIRSDPIRPPHAFFVPVLRRRVLSVFLLFLCLPLVSFKRRFSVALRERKRGFRPRASGVFNFETTPTHGQSGQPTNQPTETGEGKQTIRLGHLRTRPLFAVSTAVRTSLPFIPLSPSLPPSLSYSSRSHGPCPLLLNTEST